MKLLVLELFLALGWAATSLAQVTVEEFTLHDAKRDRNMECRAYFPSVFQNK